MSDKIANSNSSIVMVKLSEKRRTFFKSDKKYEVPKKIGQTKKIIALHYCFSNQESPALNPAGQLVEESRPET